MKTKVILFLLLFISGMLSAQVRRVAILEVVDKENKVSYANKLILRANLSKAITNTAGYEAYDRTDIDAIMGEQNFQRTGMVSNDQIKRLGEMTGANYILVTEAVILDSRTMFITAKLLDVETARTIMTDNVMMGNSSKEIQDGCVNLSKKLFHAPTEEITKVSEVKVVKEDKPTVELVRNSKEMQKYYGLSEYSYGETQMDKKAYAKFLRDNSPELYQRYLNGDRAIKAGWSLFSIGCAAIIAGGACIAFSMDEDFCVFGMMIPGAAIAVISVPILGAGYGVRDNVYKRFNTQKNRTPALSLDLQSSQNGIGLALKF
ncbi:MAG: hypothetical protein UIC49_05070 [Paludibacteraceae bacterium]|nr:hypothetical protein [Paludibacteraceae bacterium]